MQREFSAEIRDRGKGRMGVDSKFASLAAFGLCQQKDGDR